MMKRTFTHIAGPLLLLLCALLPSALLSSAAQAAPAEGTVSRYGFEVTSFQERLRLQSLTGATDDNVANYKGVVVSYEKQWRYKSGEQNAGYGLELFYGQGQASGGTGDFGTGNTYKVGSVPWMLVGLEPKMIWGWSESIDFGLGAGGTYRVVSFPDSATVRATTSRAFSGVVFFDIDVQVSEHISAKQSLGLSNIDVGPMLRWGLTYDMH